MSSRTERTVMPPAPTAGRRLAGLAARGGALPLLLLICLVIFQSGNPRFLSQANLLNMLQQGIYLLLIALGQMAVLLSGGFDLSVGANVALTSIISGNAMVMALNVQPDHEWLAVAAGFAATVAVGLFAGLANGLGVS